MANNHNKPRAKEFIYRSSALVIQYDELVDPRTGNIYWLRVISIEHPHVTIYQGDPMETSLPIVTCAVHDGSPHSNIQDQPILFDPMSLIDFVNRHTTLSGWNPDSVLSNVERRKSALDFVLSGIGYYKYHNKTEYEECPE